MTSDNNDGSQGPKVTDPDKPLMEANTQRISQTPKPTNEAGISSNPFATPIPLSSPADVQFSTEVTSSQFSAPATSTAPSQPINNAMTPPVEVNTGGSVLEVQPAPDINRRNFSPIKIIILAIIFVFFTSMACLAAFSMGYLKNNYVPVLSGLFEDFLLSDGEQLSLRTKYILGTGTYQLLTKHGKYFRSDIVPDKIKPIGADKIVEEIGDIEDVNYKISAEAKFDFKEPLLESVLGATDPGEINDDTIDKILSSKEGTIKISLENYIEFKNNRNAQNQVEIDLQVPGVNLNTLLEFKKVAKDLYLNINRFPKTSYFRTEMVVGKWLKTNIDELMPQGQFAREAYSQFFPFSSVSESETDELPEESKINLSQKDYNKILRLLGSDAFKNSVSESYAEKIAGEDAKCYVFTINKNNYTNLLAEISEEFFEDNVYTRVQLDEIITDWPYTKFDIHLCLGKMITYPLKFKIDMNWVYDGTKIVFVMDEALLAIDPDSEVAPPKSYTNFSDLDWENIQTSKKIAPIYVEDTEKSTSSGALTSENICRFDYYPKGCMLCRTDPEDCKVCLDLYNGNTTNFNEEIYNKCF